MNNISVAIADDHQLFLKSLSILISGIGGFSVATEALNGQDLMNKLQNLAQPPDIVLLDVNMPVMNGVETAVAVAAKYPGIKIIALSMKDDDSSIIDMLKAGCCCYLLKDIHPTELEKALVEIYKNGFYNADALNLRYRRMLLKPDIAKNVMLTEKEKRFLQLACSDFTYKQIAMQMHVSERTVDGYREALFEKLSVQSRTGMALEGIRRNLVTL